MIKKIVAVGIDVAKATLSVCIHYQDGNEKALTIRNTETDINTRLLTLLKNCKGKIVMESTGHYHWLSAIILSENDCDVRIVNPILAKQYTTGNIRKVKSDPQDAQGLARMARIADNLPRTFTSTRKKLWMRKKLGLLASLAKQIQALNASITSIREAQEIVDGSNSVAIKEIEDIVHTLHKSKEYLEKECVEESRRDNANQMQLLTTIPGISDFVAALCIHWFNHDIGTTAKSWIAYAGMDVSVKESGTWRGHCKLTKRGNAFLRKRLFCAAWGAWMHNPEFKSYYQGLKDQGRPHVEILIVIARKIIRIAFSVLEAQKPYDAKKCF